MIENRGHPRHIVAGMGIRARTLFNAEVEILDISTSGASVSTTKSLQIGSEYLFKVEYKDSIISVKGVIVWATLTGSRKISEEETMPIYTAGVAFSDMLTDKAEELKEFIAFKTKELRELRLCGVRIKIDAPGKAVLSHLETCVVKDISFGGVRIETGEEPSVETAFQLELVLAENEAPLRSTARVVFCQQIPEETPQRYTVGVEFADMPDEDRARLKQFIETLPGKSSES